MVYPNMSSQTALKLQKKEFTTLSCSHLQKQVYMAYIQGDSQPLFM